MNKTKMTLAITGGVTALAILVMGYFTWAAFAAKAVAVDGDEDEGTDGLETVIEKARNLVRKPIYPCAASVTALESNRTQVAKWIEESRKFAARGDRVFEKTTPAAFKTFIVSDAKRLAALPGAANGVLVKPDFAFGPFREYIVEGKMPAEPKLAQLQRQWDDVSLVVEILAKCGIAELKDVQLKEKDPVAADAGKGPKARKQPAGKAESAEAGSGPASFSYVFAFATRPAGFVKALNELAVCERFVSVESFSFVREKDAIALALGGSDEKKAEVQSGRRNRRSRRAETEEKKETEDGRNGLVTDPLLDAPFTVTMTVTVYDFRSLEDDKEKGESK